MTNNMEQNNEKIIKTIKNYWPIIIFIGITIFSWAIFQSTLGSNTDRIDKLEASQNDSIKDIGEIKTSIKGIETNIGFLLEEYRKNKR